MPLFAVSEANKITYGYLLASIGVSGVFGADALDGGDASRAFFLLPGIPDKRCGGVFIGENARKARIPAADLQENWSNSIVASGGGVVCQVFELEIASKDVVFGGLEGWWGVDMRILGCFWGWIL